MAKRRFLFKVLDSDMRSGVNGTNRMCWELGKWYHEDKAEICVSGLHLTVDPGKWMKQGYVVCIAEARKIVAWQEDKCVCNDARILAVVSQPAFEAYLKVKQQAWEAYLKVKQPAWEAYLKVKQPAWEAYLKVEQQAFEAYLKVKQPAFEALWLQTYAEFKKQNK